MRAHQIDCVRIQYLGSLQAEKSKESLYTTTLGTAFNRYHDLAKTPSSTLYSVVALCTHYCCCCCCVSIGHSTEKGQGYGVYY